MTSAPLLAFPIIVSRVLKHTRTIRGGKDTLGQPYTESVDLGFFIHLEMEDGEPLGVAFGVGAEHPPVKAGDKLVLSLTKG